MWWWTVRTLARCYFISSVVRLMLLTAVLVARSMVWSDRMSVHCTMYMHESNEVIHFVWVNSVYHTSIWVWIFVFFSFFFFGLWQNKERHSSLKSISIWNALESSLLSMSSLVARHFYWFYCVIPSMTKISVANKDRVCVSMPLIASRTLDFKMKICKYVLKTGQINH